MDAVHCSYGSVSGRHSPPAPRPSWSPSAQGLDGIDLKPEEIAHVLRGAISVGSLGVEASL
ncbi:hypothetical protein [Streptomyces nymphaeiformis]|uniref:Uncharacterized protein n=1 Tax=Streptomyces nymphaeiformis TaxID=2663842 RepID=A0A7W7U8C1_9ACTN|nr:hypothetical protein [Streptomyces nymphaeiformis]MBB4986754.1 hypothetical protein [Streptomyces nymphaeiformis]